MIDSHAHLDACDDPTAVVARGQAAGVTRIVTIGTGIESCRAALALADRHDEVYAALVPLDRILVETDSPHLAPQPIRGRPNEPANIVHTLGVLAAARGEELAALATQIDRNATVAFGLGTHDF